MGRNISRDKKPAIEIHDKALGTRSELLELTRSGHYSGVAAILTFEIHAQPESPSCNEIVSGLVVPGTAPNGTSSQGPGATWLTIFLTVESPGDEVAHARRSRSNVVSGFSRRPSDFPGWAEIQTAAGTSSPINTWNPSVRFASTDKKIRRLSRPTH